MSGSKESRVTTAAIDLVAGSLAGIANVLVGQPLDTIKVKMQTFPSLNPSPVTCFRKTLAQDGLWRGLYAGTVPAIAANVAENSVLFCSYGLCQDLVKRVSGQPEVRPLQKAVAGLGAGFLTSFVICPTELIKCRMQSMRESGLATVRTGTFHLTRHIVRTEGLIGLFRGMAATMAREVPGFFCFFGAYEVCKDLISGPGPQDPSLFSTIASGATAGAFLWLSIFPLDLIKSRLQVLASDPSPSFTAICRQVYRRDGVRGFYRGLSPTLLRTMPSTAALFVTYEYSTRLMNSMTGN